MQKMMKNCALLLFGIVMLLINGCKKDGNTGPQGPQGIQGAEGHTKIISATFSVPSWAYTSPHYYMNLAVPELTASNLDSSLVMVYFSTIGPNWLALPYTQYNSPSDYYMGFSCSNGMVQITWTYDSSLSSGLDPNAYYLTTVKCKIVMIPPQMKKKVNHLNYPEVQAAYNLKD